MYTQVNDEPNTEELRIAGEMLKLMSDPTRLKILWALLHSEHSVNELADHVAAQPAAVSQHLTKLRLAQLVKVRREGTKMFYSTDNKHVHGLIAEALVHARHVTERGKE